MAPRNSKGKRYSQKCSPNGTNLCDERGYQMSTVKLMKACGVQPGPKGGMNWPLAGFPDWIHIGDTIIFVHPANVGNDRRHKSSKHRVYAMCNNCMKTVPAGRLGQHRWACEGA